MRCAGPAREVFAVGTFNGWASPTPLAAGPDGAFRAELELKPGIWRVACERHLADGSVVHEPPSNAERVVDDGFGGRDGVFEVPSAAGQMAE